MAKSWEQILGGYATDTLTAAEKRKLFEAALYDQALFDALADEEALKALLSDPKARQRILASLEASLEPQWIASSRPTWFKWFRKPSSLAWVGGMAAAGLALIFGWQMNTDWGSIVQQHQEIEQSVLEKKVSDENEGADLSQPTPSAAPLEENKQSTQFRKNDEGLPPNPAQPQSAIAPLPEPNSEIAKSSDKLRQDQEVLKRERREQDGGLDSLSSEIRERVAGDSEPIPVQEKLPLKSAVQPLVMSDEAKIRGPADAKLAPMSEPVIAEASKEDSLPPPGALDQFYAGLGARDLGGKGKTDSANQTRDKASNKASLLKAQKEDKESMKANVENDKAVIQKARGIRYSFIREMEKKEEELGEGPNITGDWRDVRLTIEPNEASYIYAFAPIGRGNWQQLAGTLVVKPKDNSDPGKVKAYQNVEFSLGVIANRFGKLVISTITVLISPTPLESFDRWIGGRANTAQLQIERMDDSVYVVRTEGDSDEPFRVDIALED